MDMKFLSENNFLYLCKGLTIDKHDMKVLDAVLVELDKKNGVLSKIVSNNQANGFDSTMHFEGPQFIIELNKYKNQLGKTLSTSLAKSYPKGQNMQPVIHVNLHSPSLDIPQRVEIPLRYVVNGASPLENTFMVYLHALEVNNNEKFVYYGVTKRSWMKRFDEHVKLALKGKSKRKFPQLLGEGVVGRFHELLFDQSGKAVPPNTLIGSHHVVCAAGRTSKDAHQIEKYLIDKHSLFNSKGHRQLPFTGQSLFRKILPRFIWV